jgi:DNA-binding IclR family transcriptional regulator
MCFCQQNIVLIFKTENALETPDLAAQQLPAAARTRAATKVAPSAGTGTLDLALRLVEFLAHSNRQLPLGAIARHFNASKATVYRHLCTLRQHGFVQQDLETGRYEAGIKLVVLGEAARWRFDVVSASRDALMVLRDTTRQAATICALVENEIVVLDLIQGGTVIEFGTRPGTRLDIHSSAHGRVWLAFGPSSLLLGAHEIARRLPGRSEEQTGLVRELELVRARGWATAPDQIIAGVNALAAPVFDFSNRLAGSVAIVGATQFIPAEPNPEQIAAVVSAAAHISRGLGWRAAK